MEEQNINLLKNNTFFFDKFQIFAFFQAKSLHGIYEEINGGLIGRMGYKL